MSSDIQKLLLYIPSITNEKRDLTSIICASAICVLMSGYIRSLLMFYKYVNSVHDNNTVHFRYFKLILNKHCSV